MCLLLPPVPLVLFVAQWRAVQGQGSRVHVQPRHTEAKGGNKHRERVAGHGKQEIVDILSSPAEPPGRGR